MREGESASRDYRSSRIGRRRSWYGLKRPVKRFLAMRLPHSALRLLARAVPSLAAEGRLPAPASLDEVEGTIDGRSFVMRRPDRCVVAKELYWGHGRRPRAQDNFAVELFASRSLFADVVFDVGAYTGLFSLVAAAVNPNARIHAFEIVPEVQEAFLDNCRRNQVLDRVTLHRVGLGEAGRAMQVPATSEDSALPSFYSGRLHFESGELVRFHSLDEFSSIPGDGARVLMKIDVEGTEHEILRHGRRFLETFRPDILCEVLAGVAHVAELEALLSPHSYRYFLVRGDALEPQDAIHPHEEFRDWFFTTGSPDDLRATGIRGAS